MPVARPDTGELIPEFGWAGSFSSLQWPRAPAPWEVAGLDQMMEILTDGQVVAAWQQRQRSLIAAPWRVDPASEDQRDVAAAEIVRETVERIDWDSISAQLLESVLWGYSVAEIVWARSGGGFRIEAIKPRDPRLFRFDPAGRLQYRAASASTFLSAPPLKFWVIVSNPGHANDYYGRGLARVLYRYVWLKRYVLEYWGVYLEKYGAPTAVGKFPPGTPDGERQALLKALEAIRTHTAVVLPEDIEVALLEATRSGGADYASIVDYLDRQIVKVIAGQTQTSEAGSSRAQAQVHLEVLQSIVQADADLISGSATKTWVSWLTELTLPGARPPVIYRDLSAPEDVSERARRDSILAQMGIVLRPDAVPRVYGEDYELVRPAVASAPAPVPTPASLTERAAVPRPASLTERAPIPKSASLAEPAETEPSPGEVLDALTDQLEVEARPAIDGLIAQLEAIVDGARSLGEIRERIVAAYGDLDRSRLTEILGDALAVAMIGAAADVAVAADDENP